MSVVRVYSLLDSVNPLMSFFGDSGEHETILRLLDGWLGSPDGTVDLSPLGRGNGAHDVPASDISYGERVVAVDYRILTQSRSRLLGLNARIRGFAGRPVRIRVTDDESDLFATGFLQEMSVDKTRQNMAMQTSTGTLTFVCPRPELLAWSPLQSQLFPVSAVQGGLLYSTVPKLVSAWTGTANASASTLSQNGAAVATNLSTDPTCMKNMGIYWQAQSNQNADGTWTYSLADGVSNGTAPLGNVAIDVGYVAYVKYRDVFTEIPRLKYFTLISSGPDWLLAENDSDSTRQGEINVRNPLTPVRMVLCSAADWQAMQALGVDWFSGDSYPVPTGKGLSYPLNYGTGGVTSNVELLINQGSSKAYPVLTVTGNFPNGVQIQWGGNALQYDGAIGAVPLILDSRSQTASMGGVDVSRNLSRRDFPVVPADGSVSLRLMSAGTGWVTAVCRDTYI